MIRTPFGALVQKEFREAIQSRWLAGFVTAFVILALGISWIGGLSASIGGASGFGRTTATLVNLILLIIPLMGLSAGSLSLAGERERGTLPFLLALPLRPSEIFWAKFIGLCAAVVVSLALAFGIAGLALAWRGGLTEGKLYAACFGATILLAVVSLSLGFVVSTLTRKAATAVGAAILTWLGLVFIGDLGLLGTTLAVRLRPEILLASTALNPLSLYRLMVIDLLGAPLEMLGPAGHCVQDTMGLWLKPAALTALVLWGVQAAGGAFLLYQSDPMRENQQ